MLIKALLFAKGLLARHAMNLIVIAALAGVGALLLHEIRTAAALRVEMRQAAQNVEVLRSQNEALRSKLEALVTAISARSAESDALRTEFDALRREAQAIRDACTDHPLDSGLLDLLRRGAGHAAGDGRGELPGGAGQSD